MFDSQEERKKFQKYREMQNSKLKMQNGERAFLFHFAFLISNF